MNPYGTSIKKLNDERVGDSFVTVGTGIAHFVRSCKPSWCLTTKIDYELSVITQVDVLYETLLAFRTISTVCNDISSSGLYRVNHIFSTVRSDNEI